MESDDLDRVIKDVKQHVFNHNLSSEERTFIYFNFSKTSKMHIKDESIMTSVKYNNIEC